MGKWKRAGDRESDRILKSLFPLTGRGLFLLATALIMTLLGGIRGDLAALFWGLSFLLFLIYTLAGNHLSRVIARKALSPEDLDLKLSSRGVFPGEMTEAYLKVILPKARIPGFFIFFKATLHWKTGKEIVLIRRVTAGENVETVVFKSEERGMFRCTSINLCFCDYFGFTLGSISSAIDESIPVYPSLVPVEEILLHLEGGNSTEHRDRNRKKDELLEVRKYFPGDDTRRLNWKIFAHFGELFLREGEYTPPPVSNLLFILDTSPAALESDTASDYLEGLVRLAASIMMLFLMQNSCLTLTMPGSRMTTYNGEQKTELLSLMSAVWWAKEGLELPLPEERNLHAVIFSSPNSSDLETIIRSAKKRGWHITLFFKKLTLFEADKTDAKKRKLNLRDIFFLNRQDRGQPRKSTVTGAEFKKSDHFMEILLKEISKYRNTPWNVRDVRSI